MSYYCYLIINENNRTYIGITNNLEKRIKQHNNLLKGGAKSTRCSNNWTYKIILENFNKSCAACFEWYWKHEYINNKWIKTKNKLLRLQELLNNNEWNYINVHYIT